MPRRLVSMLAITGLAAATVVGVSAPASALDDELSVNITNLEIAQDDGLIRLDFDVDIHEPDCSAGWYYFSNNVLSFGGEVVPVTESGHRTVSFFQPSSGTHTLEFLSPARDGGACFEEAPAPDAFDDHPELLPVTGTTVTYTVNEDRQGPEHYVYSVNVTEIEIDVTGEDVSVSYEADIHELICDEGWLQVEVAPADQVDFNASYNSGWFRIDDSGSHEVEFTLHEPDEYRIKFYTLFTEGRWCQTSEPGLDELSVGVLGASATFGVEGVGSALSSLPSRIEGPDRYATAAAIAGEWGEIFGYAETVFVATGENYPDALSAAAAAAHLGAPLVLTPKNSLPSVVKSRLNALRPERIVVLGSSAAVSNKVVNALKTVGGEPQVVRWQGPDRYATGREIVKRAWGVNGNGDGAENVSIDTVVIATGKNFPDALSAGPAVAAVGGAVVLVDGSKSSVSAETLNLIKDLEPAHIVIAGSTAAVKAGIESQLKGVFGSGKVTRKQGPDRYATAVEITKHFFDGAGAVFFAVGTNFPDALAGAALAGQLGAPLIVTPKSCVSGGAKSLVNKLAPGKKVLLGSSKAISGNVASLKTC